MSAACKTCFFIGHRDALDTIYPALLAEVERHITELGVGEFIVGHYGRFDSLAARAVKELKARHPEIELALLLPYHPGERPVSKPDGVDSLFLSARPGNRLAPGRHPAGKPLCGGSRRLPDCGCLAAGEQCERSS